MSLDSTSAPRCDPQPGGCGPLKRLRPKHRVQVRFFKPGTRHAFCKLHIHRQARPPYRHRRLPHNRGRADGRGLRRRALPGARLGAPLAQGRGGMGGRLRGPFGRGRLPAGSQAQPRCRSLVAARRRGHSRKPGRRHRGLGTGRPAPRNRRQATAAGRPRAHRLGHARATQDRPDRLSLADPALCRPSCGLPLREGLRGGGGREPLRRHALRRRGRILEPPGRALLV